MEHQEGTPVDVGLPDAVAQAQAAAVQAAAAQAAADAQAAAVQHHELAAQDAAAAHAAAIAQHQMAEHHQQLLQQHHDAAVAAAAAAGHALDPAALAEQQHQLGGVTLADPAQMAAAIAAGLIGPSSLGMAQLLAGTPVMSAQLLAQQAHGAEALGLGEMGGGAAQPQRPGSIQRGQEGYSRKAKSLSLLCENFVGQFGQVVNQVINLDNAAAQLGVERRRIYDIVNVLESIKVVSKLQKNQYQWHGTGKLLETLQELHDEAQREMEELQAKSMAGDDLAALGLDDRKEKSMSRLSQRFVQMFMLSKTRSLGLDEAARALLGGNEDQGQYKTKVRRLYDIANILSALKIIEKTHVGDKGKPGFRWLGPEGLQSLRPIAAAAHMAAAPAAAAFHMQPGGFQAALAGELPALNIAGAVAGGALPEGAQPEGVQLPAPASLYVGDHTAAAAAAVAAMGVQQPQAAASPTAAAATSSGGIKRPRRKSLRAREAAADTDEEGGEEGDEEYAGEDEEGGRKTGQKRIKVDPQQQHQQQQQQQQQQLDAAAAQQAAAAAAAAAAQQSGSVAMFSELPIMMPGTDPAAVAAAMAQAGYMDMAAAHAAGQPAPKPKVHPLLKFMELEQQTEQGPAGMRRVVGAEIVRADGHAEGQAEGAQAAWPAAAWGGMPGMEWLANPAMAGMYGSFWPASAYANMATQQQQQRKPEDGQPGAEGDAAAAAAGAEHVQQQHDAAAAALPQVTFPGGVAAAAAAAAAPGAEGHQVVGAHDAAAGADVASGQPMVDPNQAGQASNPLAWQYWQYMYAANMAQAGINPSVYTNMYQNWTKKHDGTDAEVESAPGGMEGAAAVGEHGAAAGEAPADPSGLPMGAYPVAMPDDMSGYAEAQQAQQAHHAEAAQQVMQQDPALMGQADPGVQQ